MRSVEAYAWGLGTSGQLGDNASTSSATPVKMKLRDDCRPTFIDAGALFSVVLSQKGEIFACGCAKHNRLGSANNSDVAALEVIVCETSTKFQQVSCGIWHGAAISFLGKVYTWGYDGKYGVLGRSEPTPSPMPVSSISSVRIAQVSCGHNYTLALSNKGQIYSWGAGRHGVLGNDSNDNIPRPKPMERLSVLAFKFINAGAAHCGAISDDDRLYMWGNNDSGQLGFGEKRLGDVCLPDWNQSLMQHRVAEVSCSKEEHNGFTLVRTHAGRVFSFGSNQKGKLGIGSTSAFKASPSEITPAHFCDDLVTQISTGANHAAAITQSRHLYVWGCAKDGKLGPAFKQNTAYSNVPVQFEGIGHETKFKQVTCSHHHTACLIEN